MGETSVRECSVARTLEIVGEKWTLLVVRELLLGNLRFDGIVARTGGSRDILAARLRKLEQHDLIERVAYQERPVRYEYRLTARGASLQPVVTILREWGDAHLAGSDGPPVVFRHSCGARLHAVVVCEACGEPVSGDDLTAERKDR
ncbi:MAG: helix-turn-helix domain-containing protein [Patulibacter sp.]